jgi:hypothetical protein
MNSGSIMSVAFSWQVLLWDIGPNTVPAGGEGMKALPYQSMAKKPCSKSRGSREAPDPEQKDGG